MGRKYTHRNTVHPQPEPTMTHFRSVAFGQQLMSLALAALVTAGVLVSLEAKADSQHAAVMAQSQQASPTRLQATAAAHCDQRG